MIALLISGLIPPAVKKGHFHYREFIFGVLKQLADHSINCVLYSCKLGTHVSSIEIVIYGFEPAHIIMGMRDKMDCDSWGIRIRGLLVMLPHHIFIVKAQSTVRVYKEEG